MRIALSGAMAMLAAFSPAAADETPALHAVALPARIEVEPGAPGLRQIELPDLVFVLSIDPDCAGGDVESISISVADTSETLDARDLEGHSVVEATLAVPAQQTGPLAVADFCPAQQAQVTSPDTQRVPDALTAHLSLRCMRDGKPSLIYATVPLSLELHCAIPQHAVQISAQVDSDSADPSPRF
jgi:hypothetical protein